MDTKPSKPDDPQGSANKQDPKKDKHFYDRWQDPEDNKMGNDITGDVKVANSHGHLEGGHDKRWHLEEDDQD